MPQFRGLMLLSLLLAGVPHLACAQIMPGMGEGATSGRFVEAPRGIQRELREAEQSLAEESYSDAVVRLGNLLAGEAAAAEDGDLSGQDFFLQIDDTRAPGTPVTSSLLRTARSMIGQLPDSAIETYELRYGPLARKMLTEAAQTRDWKTVREVRRKYFHTQAGYEASLLLAQHEMLTGHALAASLLLDDMVTVPRAINHLGQGVLLLHAAAQSLSQRTISTPFNGEQSEVQIGGQSLPLPAANELSGWLTERFGSLEGYTPPLPKDYPMLGGSPDRNGDSAGQLPLTNVRWSLDTTASPRQKREVGVVGESLATSGKLPPPTWTPLRVGDQLLMRTTERLVGVDYRTGKRVWTYPWQAAYESSPEDDESLEIFGGESTDPTDLISQRVWNDLPYGQISSDGERVFMLDDLGEVESANYSSVINLRGTRPADTRVNTLVALDLATEGKLLWRLGAGADDDPRFAEAFFLGPPLPLDGLLYVMVEIAGDINLCCLHPGTGDELWRQQLVTVESGVINVDPIRRVAGAMLTYHEGLLICPTGAGAIVAYDLGDRMLRWGVNYDRNGEMNRSVNVRGPGIETQQLMQRWHTGVAIAAGQSVLVTPIESDRLFGFDLLSGNSLFQQKNRVNFRYLAGIRGDSFYVAGSNQVRAFKLSDGSLQWTTPGDLVSAGQQISGQGVFGPDDYLIPTTANQVIRISLSDGKVLERRNTRFPLGNLVAADGEIISQGPAELAVAFGEATLEPIVDRMLEADPNDFEALVRKSELLIQQGDREGALNMLSRARQMEPDNDEVRMLSVSAMLGTLRENLNVDADVIQTLDELIDQPAQRIELLSLRIRAAMAREAYADAAQRLIELSSLIIAEPLLEAAASQVVSDPSRHCNLDSWIAARVDQIVHQASESDLQAINESVAKLVELQREGPNNLLRRVIRHFEPLTGIQPLRSELLDRYRKEDSHLERERLSLGIQIPSAGNLASLPVNRLISLADTYANGGMPEDAFAVLDQTKSLSAAGTELSPEDTAMLEQISQLALGKLREPTWQKYAALNWTRTESRIRPFTVKQRPLDTVVLAGKSFEGWLLISETINPLGLRDPMGLIKRIPMEIQVDNSEKTAIVCGGVMVVMMQSGLVCVDLYHLLAGDGESVLWHRSLGGESAPLAVRGTTTNPFDDQVYRYNISSAGATNPIPEFKLGPILGDRLLVLQGGDLMAIDLFTNETLWRNSDAPRSGAVLCDGKRVAVVSSDTNEVVFFDMLDGQKLESTAWTHGRIWESMGEHVLSYVPGEERKHQIRLVNPFTDQVLVRRDCLEANRTTTDIPSTYGRVVGGRYLGLLDSDGQSVVWDIKEGREIGQPKLPAYPDLQGLQAMLLEGQIVLMPKRRTIRAKLPEGQQLQTTDGAFHRTVDGVYAISLADGTLRWSHDFDQPWGCTLTQPAQTPLLMLTRSPFTYSVQSRKKFLDTLALDVRNGNKLNENLGKPILSQNNELEVKLTVQPVLSRVIAQVGPELMTYTFTETETTGQGSTETEENLEFEEVPN
jgi:outer membrane protein assembly factor BamB